MKIYYIGNQVAGQIGRLTILSLGHTITTNIDDCDVILCVHGRKIIPKEIFNKPRMAAINIHPYLYRYKGADPIGRAIKESCWYASVGAHHITEEIDGGKVIAEFFTRVTPTQTRSEIYNQLYETYQKVIEIALYRVERTHLSQLPDPEYLATDCI